MPTATQQADLDGAPEGGGVPHALGVAEVTRRAPSLGLVGKIAAATVVAAGAVFSFGMAWGRSTEDGTASVRTLREEVARLAAEAATAKADLRADTAALRAEDAAAALRLKLLEQVAGGLTPAVDRLGVTVDRLAGTVDTLRVTVAEQTVEMRYVKESLQRIEAAKAAREPASGTGPR